LVLVDLVCFDLLRANIDNPPIQILTWDIRNDVLCLKRDMTSHLTKGVRTKDDTPPVLILSRDVEDNGSYLKRDLGLVTSTHALVLAFYFDSKIWSLSCLISVPRLRRNMPGANDEDQCQSNPLLGC
jgi:hypothetical protein